MIVLTDIKDIFIYNLSEFVGLMIITIVVVIIIAIKNFFQHIIESIKHTIECYKLEKIAKKILQLVITNQIEIIKSEQINQYYFLVKYEKILYRFTLKSPDIPPDMKYGIELNTIGGFYMYINIDPLIYEELLLRLI